jgi:hypothetical protein
MWEVLFCPIHGVVGVGLAVVSAGVGRWHWEWVWGKICKIKERKQVI